MAGTHHTEGAKTYPHCLDALQESPWWWPMYFLCAAFTIPSTREPTRQPPCCRKILKLGRRIKVRNLRPVRCSELSPISASFLRRISAATVFLSWLRQHVKPASLADGVKSKRYLSPAAVDRLAGIAGEGFEEANPQFRDAVSRLARAARAPVIAGAIGIDHDTAAEPHLRSI